MLDSSYAINLWTVRYGADHDSSADLVVCRRSSLLLREQCSTALTSCCLKGYPCHLLLVTWQLPPGFFGLFVNTSVSTGRPCYRAVWPAFTTFGYRHLFSTSERRPKTSKEILRIQNTSVSTGRPCYRAVWPAFTTFGSRHLFSTSERRPKTSKEILRIPKRLQGTITFN